MNSSFDNWRACGMIYNRFTPVRQHFDLKEKLALAKDLDEVKEVVSRLIDAAMPISNEEERVFRGII